MKSKRKSTKKTPKSSAPTPAPKPSAPLDGYEQAVAEGWAKWGDPKKFGMAIFNPPQARTGDKTEGK